MGFIFWVWLGLVCVRAEGLCFGVWMGLACMRLASCCWPLPLRWLLVSMCGLHTGLAPSACAPLWGASCQWGATELGWGQKLPSWWSAAACTVTPVSGLDSSRDPQVGACP